MSISQCTPWYLERSVGYRVVARSTDGAIQSAFDGIRGPAVARTGAGRR